LFTAYRLHSPNRKPWETRSAETGGRWNAPGYSAIYLASSLSLACLEALVHIRDPRAFPNNYVYSAVQIAEKSIVTVRPKEMIGPIGEPNSIGSAFLSAFEESPLPPRANWLQRGLSPRGKRPWSDLFPEPYFTVDPEQQFIEDTVAMAVRSAVVAEELNYIVSPYCRLFEYLKWSEPKPFRFDLRLLDVSLR
jgi:RES domain-containing protein